jgi:hypothetical protein
MVVGKKKVLIERSSVVRCTQQYDERVDTVVLEGLWEVLEKCHKVIHPC